MVLILGLTPDAPDGPAPRVTLGSGDGGAWNFQAGEWVRDYPPTYATRVVRWDATVPTEGRSLILVGLDGAGTLHARVFDSNGSMAVDGDETSFAGTLLAGLKNRVRRILIQGGGVTLSDALWIAHDLRIEANGGRPFDDPESAAFRPLAQRGGSLWRSVFRVAEPRVPVTPAIAEGLASSACPRAGSPLILQPQAMLATAGYQLPIGSRP